MKPILLLLMACCCFGTVSSSPLVSSLTPPGDPSVASTNKADQIPSGLHVFGVFHGRTPCRELSQLLNTSASEECIKIKCRLILYQNPTTHVPTTYDWKGKVKWTGKWSVTKGTKTDPNATVYELEPPDSQGFLALLKIDDNILCFLNKQGVPLGV